MGGILSMNYKAESLNRLAFPLKFGDRPCRIYGTDCAEYLLLQMTDEHELQRMDNEVAAIAQGAAHPFLFAAIPVESWNDELSPWKSPAVWGKESFGGNAAGTLRFLTEQAIPTLKKQFALPENVRIILGGYSLAGLFALWASTQTALFSGVAAASPSVWFPGWMEFEQQHPIQAQCIYLSLGDREERTKNATMAAVGDNIRALHRELVERGKNCTLEWNNGGHFKDADLRTARAFRWAMEDMR
jgi:predicted hydrolase of the alpha/beta superfamily